MVKFRKKKFRHPPAQLNNKRGRLIVRNLPFSVTEDSLRNHFSPYGELKEINLLKKPNGKLVGCAFVQYAFKQCAAKAIHYISGKSFDGRVIIVDWAVPKNKFSESEIASSAPKEEPADEVIKSELDDEKNENFDELANSSSSSEDEILDEVKSEGNVNEDFSSVSEEKPKPRPSHDISEGRTIFLKNVPFDLTNDELKAFMENFGPVFYAVICTDPLTEHSKGTAFVKFKDRKSAEDCLAADQNLILKGSHMQALPALDKNSLSNKGKEKHPDKKKDNRNLYLVKEGVIVAGTRAAEDVSMADMQKRLELEMWKSNMLRNLNMFISRTRLIIHNLPMTYDDAKLRELFKKYSPPKSHVLEAKVMRNFHQLDADGKPTSKGYGFVSFKIHEDAIAALRAINNNPNIFNKNKRPIVAFSIENRAVLNVKRKRMEKSQLNNPRCPTAKKPAAEELPRRRAAKRMRSDQVPTFAGIEAHLGHTKLASKRKVQSQGAIHMERVREKKREARKQQLKQMRKETKREPKVKPNRKTNNFDETQFKQLVDKYKSKINPDSSALKKWYEN